ncbi:MAG: protein kinase, partial [Planctomycetota bacterium]|nr:protein kinase [Planctomycetota bacterium]
MGKIEFTCPNSECSTRLKASDDKAGSKIKCPACGTVGSVPENSGTAIESLMRDKGAGLSSWKREGELARGGMGEVIRGQDRILSRPLAMKVMRQQIADSEEHRLRFLEEARITGQLEHPNIVPIHELGKDPDGNFYFTMKLVKGRSLGQVLRDMVNGSDEEKPDGLPPSRQPLTINHLLGIFLKVCDAIAFAHSKGVIHRDLKPDNIMIGNFGEVLVMDWGLAKVVATGSLPVGSEKINVQRSDADAARASDTAPASSVENPASSGEPQVSSIRADTDIAVTVEGAIQGTPAYMPPEQAEGDLSKIDHRSDIYSLGAILYEILTLRRPFEGKTVHDVLLRVVEGRVLTPEKRAPDRDIPAELAAVAMKAMSKSRLKRYQSVVELSQDINLYLEGRGVSAKEDSFVESFSKLIRRNKAVSIAVGVAVSVLFLMGGVFTWDNAHKRKTAEDAFAQVVVE